MATVWYEEAGDKGAFVGLALSVTNELQRTMSYEIPKTNLPGHARGTRPAPRSGGCLPPGWQSLLGTHPTDAPPSCSSGLTTGQGALRSGPGGRAGRTRERGACGTGTDVWPELWGATAQVTGTGRAPQGLAHAARHAACPLPSSDCHPEVAQC